MFDDHRHIRVTSKSVATVSPNCSPETLELLRKMAEAVEKKVDKITEAMESIKIFPVRNRVKDGIYKKKFDSGNSFKHLLSVMNKYHFALNAAEYELLKNSMDSNTEKIFPKTEREPLDYGNEYVGVSKMAFFGFIKSVKKYHQALSHAEYVFINNKLKK
mgnify:CR=1 FL=1